MSIFFISSNYFKTTLCEHSQLVLGLASYSLMMGVFRDTHYTVLTFDWQLTGYYASLNWIEALMDLCLKVLIMSIVALRRWVRKQRTVGQGWSLDLGKGIVERLCIRGKSAHLKVGEVIRPLGNRLLWWDGGVSFIIKYFIDKLKWPLSYWEQYIREGDIETWRNLRFFCKIFSPAVNIHLPSLGLELNEWFLASHGAICQKASVLQVESLGSFCTNFSKSYFQPESFVVLPNECINHKKRNARGG